MAFSAVELTGIIEERLANYYSDVNIDEIGRVLSIGDGIARIYDWVEFKQVKCVNFLTQE